MTNRSDEPLLDIDTIFYLISEQYCRYALYYLLGHDRPVPLEELVEQVLICDQVLALDPFEGHQEIRSKLANVHLPELQEYGVINYDSKTQIIEANEGFLLLASILQHAEQDELVE